MIFCQLRRATSKDIPHLFVQHSRLLKTFERRVLPISSVRKTTSTRCSQNGLQWQGTMAKKLLQPQCQSPVVPALSFFSQMDPSNLPKYHPEKGKMVYVGTLSNTVKFVKTFSLSTSIIGLLLQPYLYMNSGQQSVVMNLVVGATFSVFIFLTPIILHWVTKRYVTQMHWDAKKEVFTATTFTLFVNDKETQFRASDVSFPEVPGLFTTVYVKGKPLFVDPNLFLDKEAYISLMGYDKPIDWQMSEISDNDKHVEKKSKV